jgi:hypothetical protein
MSEVEKYTDKEIETLKEEIKFLEIEISLTAAERVDIEKQIHQYEIRYNKELGELIKKILQKKKEILKQKAEFNPNKQSEYQQAEKDYSDFESSYEEIKKIKEIILTEDEQIEIKEKFKKACKLCHPDKVSDECKEDAQRIFIELKEAYDNNNLNKVSAILEQLEKGIFTTGLQSITEKEKLQMLLNKLNLRLAKLKEELKDLKQREVYKVIASIKNFDSHFENLRQQLTIELNSL